MGEYSFREKGIRNGKFFAVGKSIVETEGKFLGLPVPQSGYTMLEFGSDIIKVRVIRRGNSMQMQIIDNDSDIDDALLFRYISKAVLPSITSVKDVAELGEILEEKLGAIKHAGTDKSEVYAVINDGYNRDRGSVLSNTEQYQSTHTDTHRGRGR